MFDIFYSGTKPNLFAHEREASDIKHARELSRTRYFWWITYLADLSTWDFLWEPKPWEAHQRHAWRSQHQMDSGIYLVPKDWDETQTNYHNSPQITRLPCREHWQVPDYIDSVTVDFSWHPNPVDTPYVYHFPSQWQPASGVTYTAPGATEIKILTEPQVKSGVKYLPWYVPIWIKFDSVDFSWHPNPLDPPCNYMFDTKWHWDRVGGPEYRVPGATDVKYLDVIVADTVSNENFWRIPRWIDSDSIDRTWVPNPADPPYVYEFAVEWGWNNIGGPEYHAPGATERKYVDYFVARTLPDAKKFIINHKIDPASDVLRWAPNPAEPPYIYVFGNQWYPAEIMPTVEYHVPGATERKYMEYPRATLVEHHDNHWNTLVECEWDYSWVPDPGDPPYIYVFGNQWYPATVMPTVEYTVEGATERKYMDYPRAQLLNTHEHWYLSCKEHAFSFDISWCPDPGDAPYIYVFGNQWHSAEVMSTIEYRVPGAVEVKYMEHPRATILPNQQQWVTPDEIDQSNVDYSWIPDPGSPPYIYHFGTDYQASVGLTYHVPDATELKFAGDIPRIEKTKSAVTIQDIFYLDYSNAMSQQRFAQLQQRYPHIQKVRYVNSVMDTVKRCLPKTKQNRFWVISSENDYSDFDFAWHAEPWQSGMTHVFGTQWNKWSNTLLINRWEFERCAKWAKTIEDFPNLNFVKDQQVHAPADASDIYVIDFGNQESRQVIDTLSAQYRVVKTARYFDNYLDTLKRIVADTVQEHIWVVGTICDYAKFDFSWQPEAWQRTMLHVFPSDGEKFGDTFYIHVPSFVEQMNKIELLDWFETVNYCADQSVTRFPLPVIVHDYDTHVDAVKSSNWDGPLAVFATHNMPASVPCVPLWRDKTKTIVPLSPGASSAIVPKSAVPYIKTQLYDYPYIDKKQRHLRGDNLLDIVFIDNGEPNAEENYQHLKWAAERASDIKIHRSSGVNGRVAAYHAAAELSTTPWFFAVFAKLRVREDFDWAWQPDRLQEAKHYIFHAYNPVNGLTYGHQAMIAYNKKLVLNNSGVGLDFTLDSAHEVVPIVSGTAEYAYTPWMAWRTAFRECIKLQSSVDVESQYRLSQWLKDSTTANGMYSMQGAQDAVEYYNQVGGDFDLLKKSYDWEWLASYALLKRNLIPSQ
jgi:hypothetical protein